MNTIRINGVTITGGRSIVINNGRVVVDGNDVTPNAKDIRIEVNGDVDDLDVDACSTVKVTGSVRKLSTVSGDVECGNVGGDVKTVSGDVTCGTISGRVSTVSGDIDHG